MTPYDVAAIALVFYALLNAWRFFRGDFNPKPTPKDIMDSFYEQVKSGAVTGVSVGWPARVEPETIDVEFEDVPK